MHPPPFLKPRTHVSHRRSRLSPCRYRFGAPFFGKHPEKNDTPPGASSLPFPDSFPVFSPLFSVLLRKNDPGDLTRAFFELCSFVQNIFARQDYKEETMPRPRHCRYVSSAPSVTYFKPRGIPLRELQEACLCVDELEALRLADAEGLTAQEAAQHMRVSRHTFGRTLASARRTVALALTQGMALRIEGGTYAVVSDNTYENKEHTMQKISNFERRPHS